MSRKEKVLEASRKMIDEGDKVSASQLSNHLDWPEEDVHRCLNALEREGLVKSSTKEFAGRKIRMVGVFR